MRFTIEWQPAAQQDLAAIWLAADSELRQQVTALSREIERTLRYRAATAGESRTDGRRILFARPLAVLFEVDEAAALAKVVAVWRY